MVQPGGTMRMPAPEPVPGRGGSGTSGSGTTGAGAPVSAAGASGSAREAILGRIRSSLTDVPGDVPPEADTPVPWQYRQPTAMPDVLERFVERVEDYKATVVRCPADQVPEAIAEALQVTGARNVVVPEGLDSAWRAAVDGAGLEVRVDAPPLAQEVLNDTHAVVTGATVGAAESGTIMLTHGPGEGRRALTLLPDIHVCVVRADQVVSDIPEAVGRTASALREERPVTWLSGGSATSDIELSRVEGVHGPRTLYVILAE